jgi:hypothetical protein
MLIRPKTRQGLVIFQKSYETAAEASEAFE